MKGITPKARASALKRILRQTYDEGRGVTATNIVDMLTDLRHLCDAEGLNFADCDRIAREHYRPEFAQGRVDEA